MQVRNLPLEMHIQLNEAAPCGGSQQPPPP
jgi:hypothetical protein